MGKAKTSRAKIKVKDLFVDMGTKPQIEYDDPNLQIGVDFRTRFRRRRKKIRLLPRYDLSSHGRQTLLYD